MIERETAHNPLKGEAALAPYQRTALVLASDELPDPRVSEEADADRKSEEGEAHDVEQACQRPQQHGWRRRPEAMPADPPPRAQRPASNHLTPPLILDFPPK